MGSTPIPGFNIKSLNFDDIIVCEKWEGTRGNFLIYQHINKAGMELEHAEDPCSLL
jgi:hypothetical protein